MFRLLRDLLDASGRSYAVYVSAANHETSSLEDAQAVFEEMHGLFPSLYFLGNLSDVAVHNQLRRSTYFAAFFPLINRTGISVPYRDSRSTSVEISISSTVSGSAVLARTRSITAFMSSQRWQPGRE